MNRSAKDLREDLVPVEEPIQLTPIQPKGAVRAVFWGLRVYIALMVALVVIGFLHGAH
ncbi:MAG: hypothetical protein OWU84_12305 [Firmicutes bacterium]|nr:hypothetical protein [Bacillota bacterium]